MDDKTNTDYRDINNFDDKWKITGIEQVYSLFPGESVTLTPEVRLSIDSLNPDVEGHWILGDTEVATGPSYTFKATEYGDYKLTFLATDKKTGVSFPAETEFRVAPQYKLGWLFLSRTASGNSRLSLLAGRKMSVTYMNVMIAPTRIFKIPSSQTTHISLFMVFLPLHTVSVLSFFLLLSQVLLIHKESDLYRPPAISVIGQRYRPPNFEYAL